MGRRQRQKRDVKIALKTRCKTEVRGLDNTQALCFIVTVPDFPHTRTPCLNPTWSLFHFGEPVALQGTSPNFEPLSETFCQCVISFVHFSHFDQHFHFLKKKKTVLLMFPPTPLVRRWFGHDTCCSYDRGEKTVGNDSTRTLRLFISVPSGGAVIWGNTKPTEKMFRDRHVGACFIRVTLLLTPGQLFKRGERKSRAEELKAVKQN